MLPTALRLDRRGHILVHPLAQSLGVALYRNSTSIPRQARWAACLPKATLKYLWKLGGQARFRRASGWDQSGLRIHRTGTSSIDAQQGHAHREGHLLEHARRREKREGGQLIAPYREAEVPRNTGVYLYN